MKNKEPLLIVLILFILVGLFYSPLKKAGVNKKNESKVSAPSTIGTKSQSVSYSPNKTIAENIKEVESKIKKLELGANKETDETIRSPYYNKIRMSNISGLRGTDPNKEYISLSTNLEKNETIKITGWFLKSEVTGYYAMLGKVALLPFPFTKTESDIYLQYRDRAIITKGFSPIGISFRTNKCTGFFEENRNFTPSLPLQCPRPIDEDYLPKFSDVLDRNDECLNIIKRISRCTTKGNEFVRDLPDTVSSACKNYITTQINYNTCVARHFSDTDFPGKEYRIYLNKFGPLWRTTHDTINLHDENGLIVDTISY